jgi:prepilin-type N-terminal cleavage/methylation domain-containing protein
MKTLSKNNQRGYSLIELSIALAIVGVVIAGSIVGVQAILQSNNINKTIRQTNTAVNRIVAKLVRDTNYANATTVNLSAAGMEVWEAGDITSGGVSGAASVTHPLASFVLVAPFGASGADKFGLTAQQGYVYTLTGVPLTACTDLAVGLEGLALAMSIQNRSPLAITGTAPTDVVQANLVKKPRSPFNSAAANKYCSGAEGAEGQAGESTQISFVVPRR